MPRKHRSSSNLIKLMERQKGVGRDDIQTASSRPTLTPHEPDGTYATNRHTRRMLRKLHGIEAKRMCDLKGGQK
ncbi:hypothetical protein K7009_004872 [Salmonella enterica]|uniref:Uncharacterized protein n=4 Tax=Salmonella enterica TaxID=28901 RepID=A0A5Y8IL07_SALER|nr:hypothetical protein [Salmonella enterica]EAA6777351.1 hypothetical protein [Salmonella enterica subsp. enterica serovar Braenderup]EAA7750271.1 hypothetical protein [Salmonella enterica subsp. enterica serovar Virchow]EBD3361508.1 hypothetical protein [Salmonella enterica subsp. enterica serovar Bareilly]EBG4966342.1 hypothetical protein [Salmonella enterica subsp. enterica serovar Agoueve]EBR9761610.1 hypothetical protein [Salmonella enterica subsp. enterica serovar Abony]EBV0750740.1 hy